MDVVMHIMMTFVLLASAFLLGAILVRNFSAMNEEGRRIIRGKRGDNKK